GEVVDHARAAVPLEVLLFENRAQKVTPLTEKPARRNRESYQTEALAALAAPRLFTIRIQREVPGMHFRSGICVAACVAALSGVAAAAPGGRPFRFDELASVRRVGGYSVSPDGRWVAYSAGIADVENNRVLSGLWIQAVSGGEPRKLTAGDKRDSDPKFSPDGKRLAFLSDRDGASQIFVIDPAGGEAVRAASFPADINNFNWSPD